jgi:hypothetical protein
MVKAQTNTKYQQTLGKEGEASNAQRRISRYPPDPPKTWQSNKKKTVVSKQKTGWFI